MSQKCNILCFTNHQFTEQLRNTFETDIVFEDSKFNDEAGSQSDKIKMLTWSSRSSSPCLSDIHLDLCDLDNGQCQSSRSLVSPEELNQGF